MYYYPMMFERKNLRKLPQNRDDLFRKYIYPIKSENDDARTKLMEVSMETLGRYVQNKKVVDRKLVDANYHPVVRYNAMYIIGRLNLREVNRIPGKISPNVPYRGALEFMLRELNNANQIDAVKVAALIGLARHARLDGQQRPENRLPEGHRAAIVKSVLKLLNTKASDEGRSVDGHGWLQRRAIQVLVHLDAGGPEIDQALVRIVGNGKLPLALRCAAADAQGRISNLPSLKDDPVAAAANVGTLALTACSEELRAIKTHLDRLAAAEKEAGAEGETGRPGIRDAAIRPGEAPTNAAAAAPQTDISRRRLYSRLMQLRTSIVGPPEKKPGEVGIYSHVADADGRTKVGAIYKPLAMILSRLQQPPGDLKSLYNDILKPATTLEDEIKKIVPSVAKAPS